MSRWTSAPRRIARHIAGRKHIARNTAQELDAKSTPGPAGGGSGGDFRGFWTFITIFTAILIAWVA
jgi:uncharacterized membrane protein